MNKNCQKVVVKHTRFGCDGEYTKVLWGLKKQEDRYVYKKDFTN